MVCTPTTVDRQVPRNALRIGNATGRTVALDAACDNELDDTRRIGDRNTDSSIPLTCWRAENVGQRAIERDEQLAVDSVAKIPIATHHANPTACSRCTIIARRLAKRGWRSHVNVRCGAHACRDVLAHGRIKTRIFGTRSSRWDIAIDARAVRVKGRGNVGQDRRARRVHVVLRPAPSDEHDGNDKRCQDGEAWRRHGRKVESLFFLCVSDKALFLREQKVSWRR